MIERSSFSPSQQSMPKRSLRERCALSRISRLGLLLPNGPFRGENRKQTREIDGSQTAHHTILNSSLILPYEGEGVFRSTQIEIERAPDNLHKITALTVDSVITDDVAQYYNVGEKHEQFSLTDYDNELSIHWVVNEISLAVKAVRHFQSEAKAISPRYP